MARLRAHLANHVHGLCLSNHHKVPILDIPANRPLSIATPRASKLARMDRKLERAINVLSMSLSPLPGEYKGAHH